MTLAKLITHNSKRDPKGIQENNPWILFFMKGSSFDLVRRLDPRLSFGPTCLPESEDPVLRDYWTFYGSVLCSARATEKILQSSY
jgi:hypothetical protein